jgi:C-methyltransferase
MLAFFGCANWKTRMNHTGPADILTNLYMQHALSLAILTAANLGIADRLDCGPRHVDDLADSLNVKPQALFRLMRALTSKGIFRQTGEREFTHSTLSEALRTGAPGGARDLIRAFAATAVNGTCADYRPVLRSARNVRPEPLQGLSEDPAAAAIYDSAMTAVAMTQSDAINTAFDFSPFSLLIDIGGGQGSFLASILARNPGQRGIVFDFPRVVSGSHDLLRRLDLEDRCEVRGGDFRLDVPGDGDAYILKNVLHGYPDAMCESLLSRIGARAAPGAHVLIIELVMPSDSPSIAHATFDLYLMGGGSDARVRSESEFRQLLDNAGFDLVRVVPTARLVCIVEARARR